MKPFIIKERCPAMADTCPSIKACPTGAIYYVADKSERMGGRIEVDLEKCDGCGQCADVCCGHAVEMG